MTMTARTRGVRVPTTRPSLLDAVGKMQVPLSMRHWSEVDEGLNVLLADCGTEWMHSRAVWTIDVISMDRSSIVISFSACLRDCGSRIDLRNRKGSIDRNKRYQSKVATEEEAVAAVSVQVELHC